jgi:RNA-directed DNA polymerase
LTKRNSEQPAVTATQRAGQTMNGLDRIRQAAKNDKTVRFNNLLHHVTTSLLFNAYYALKRKAKSGVDGETWQSYGASNLSEKLKDLHVKIQSGRYKPKPSKRIWIEKEDGKLRPIGISCLEDKIVQQALVMVLQEIYETEFKGFSYGFRPKKSQHQALDAVYIMLTTRRVNWILDADIKGCYDNINHEWLIKFLQARIADKRVIELVVKMLRAGIMDEGQKHPTEMGLAQGSVASPFFANIFLHYVLDLWADQWRKTQAKGECFIIRYADDFILGFQHKEDAEKMHAELAGRLEQFGLNLHETKTQLIEFGRFAEERRHAEKLGKPKVFNFLGFTHCCSKRRLDGAYTVKRITIKSKMRKKIREVREILYKNRARPVREQAKWIKGVVQGHFNYYGVPGNTHALKQFRTQINVVWFKALRRRSQKAVKLTWQKMKIIIAATMPKVRITHPYPSQRFGV